MEAFLDKPVNEVNENQLRQLNKNNIPAFAVLSSLDEMPGLPRYQEMDVTYG